MSIPLPRKWTKLREMDVGQLEKELAREVCPKHPLKGARVRALYRRYPYDDVLYGVLGADYPYYCVHLTWNVESAPDWPHVTHFLSIEDFCENFEMTLELDEDHPKWSSERWRFFEEKNYPSVKSPILRPYTTIVRFRDSRKEKHTEYMATDLDDARRQAIRDYGEDCGFSIRNEEDARKSR